MKGLRRCRRAQEQHCQDAHGSRARYLWGCAFSNQQRSTCSDVKSRAQPPRTCDSLRASPGLRPREELSIGNRCCSRSKDAIARAVTQMAGWRRLRLGSWQFVCHSVFAGFPCAFAAFEAGRWHSLNNYRIRTNRSGSFGSAGSLPRGQQAPTVWFRSAAGEAAERGENVSIERGLLRFLTRPTRAEPHPDVDHLKGRRREGLDLRAAQRRAGTTSSTRSRRPPSWIDRGTERAIASRISQNLRRIDPRRAAGGEPAGQRADGASTDAAATSVAGIARLQADRAAWQRTAPPKR